MYSLVIRPAFSSDVDAVRGVVHDAYARWVARLGRESNPAHSDYAWLIAKGRVWVLEALMVENIALDQHVGFNEIERFNRRGLDGPIFL